MKLIFVIVLLSLCCTTIFAQRNFDELNVRIERDSALNRQIQILENLKQQKDTLQLIDQLLNVSKEYRRMELYTRSLKELNNAKKLASGKYKSKIYAVYLEEAITEKLKGDNTKAITLFYKANNGFTEQKDYENLTLCKTQIGEHYRNLNDFELADNYLDSALTIYSHYRLDNPNLLSGIYNRKAAVANESKPKRLKQSVHFSKLALKSAFQAKNQDKIAISYNEIGQSYKNMGLLDSSEYYHIQAEKIWKNNKNIFGVLLAMDNRLWLYYYNPQKYPAQKVFQLGKEIIQLATENDVNYSLRFTYECLYKAKLKEKDYEEAIRYLELFNVAEADYRDKNYNLHIFNVMELYEREKIKNNYHKVADELVQTNAQKEKILRDKQQLLFSIIGLAVVLLIASYLVYRIFVTNKKLNIRDKEKDILIQEVHHRVKNNLQFICSLIDMQVRNTDNPEDKLKMEELLSRIQSISLVHELLYKYDDKVDLPFTTYINSLIKYYETLLQQTNENVHFTVHSEEIRLAVEQTVLIGMITSELIMNSVKNAFKNTAEPAVSITFQKNGNTFYFHYSDNGAGIEDTTDKKKDGLGMRLIDIFSRQLKGEYTMYSENGFHYQLKFKND